MTLVDLNLEIRIKTVGVSRYLIRQNQIQHSFPFINIGGMVLQNFFITSSKIQIRTSWSLARQR